MPPATVTMSNRKASSPRNDGIPVPFGSGKFKFYLCLFGILFCYEFCTNPFLFFVAVHIKVNITRPELNREVLIFPIVDIEGDKHQVYQGYYLMIPMDARFVLDDPSKDYYKARIFSDKSILIQIPAWHYGILNNRDEIAAHVAENVTNAMDDARHAYVEAKDAREWKYLCLEFPDGHELSTKEIVSAEGDDEELLTLEIVPVTYKNPLDKKRDRTDYWAAWKVARTDIKAQKRGKVQTKKNVSQAASLLSGLFGDDDGMKTEESL